MRFCLYCLSDTRRYASGECIVCHARRAKAYRQSPGGIAKRKALRSTPKYRAADVARQQRKRGQPEPTRARPELCEWPECTRRARVADHCHLTGVFRGWLCDNHNRGLGLIGDTNGAILAGLKYLEAMK